MSTLNLREPTYYFFFLAILKRKCLLFHNIHFKIMIIFLRIIRPSKMKSLSITALIPTPTKKITHTLAHSHTHKKQNTCAKWQLNSEKCFQFRPSNRKNVPEARDVGTRIVDAFHQILINENSENSYFHMTFCTNGTYFSQNFMIKQVNFQRQSSDEICLVEIFVKLLNIWLHLV